MWGSLLGAGVGLLGGMFSKKKSVEDPLAGVRARLQQLSSQVPGLVARQKELSAKQFGAAKEEGARNIQENVHADRGFGASSIESRLNTELMDKIARGQSEADLNAEKWGLQQEMNILGSMPGTPTEEPDNMWQTIGESLGTAFGSGNEGNKFGFTNTKEPLSTHSFGGDLAASVAKRPGVISSGGASSNAYTDLFKMLSGGN